MVSTAHRLAYLQPGGGADKARDLRLGVRDEANPITLIRGAAFQGLAGGLEGAGAAAQDEVGGLALGCVTGWPWGAAAAEGAPTLSTRLRVRASPLSHAPT